MQNPEISGIEYQQGTLQGYELENIYLKSLVENVVIVEKKTFH